MDLREAQDIIKDNDLQIFKPVEIAEQPFHDDDFLDALFYIIEDYGEEVAHEFYNQISKDLTTFEDSLYYTFDCFEEFGREMFEEHSRAEEWTYKYMDFEQFGKDYATDYSLIEAKDDTKYLFVVD